MIAKIPSLTKVRWGLVLMLLLVFLGPSTVAGTTTVITSENINKNKSLESDYRIVEEPEPELPPVPAGPLKRVLPMDRYIKTEGFDSGRRGMVQRYAAQYRVDWRLIEAIIIHETGNRTSRAFRQLNNSCGMMGRNGLMRFESEAAGVRACASNIRRNYLNRGLKTMEQMNTKYATSRAWAGKIQHFYQRL